MSADRLEPEKPGTGGPFELPFGCSIRLMSGVIGVALLVTAVYFLVANGGSETGPAGAGTGSVDGIGSVDEAGPVDETQPASGRRYEIWGVGDGGASHAYTFEFVGEGDTGGIRVLEDETGEGTFAIDGDSIRIEMERNVPDPRTQERQPNVFEGTISADGSRIEGTWSAAYYEGDADGVFHVYEDEWMECPFYAELQ